MEYKTIINDNIYSFPTLVYEFQKEILDKYAQIENDTTYIDMNLLKENESYEVLEKISTMCSDAIGQIVLYAEEEVQKNDDFWPQIRLYDNIAKINHNKGDDEKAKQQLSKLIEMTVDYYDELLKIEKQEQIK